MTVPGTKPILFPLVLLLVSFRLLWATVAEDNSSAISYEIDPFIRVYENGTIERLSGIETVPASLDPTTGVQSKDVLIVPNHNITARLFMPENAIPNRKLPLLVYFHGGGFTTQSAFSPKNHNYMNSLVAKASAVAVSVNYRLAPENPLPDGYEDSWLTLKWVFSHSRCNGDRSRLEPWLENYVDFTRVYLGGDSAGGNIAHNVAIRAGSDKSDHGVEPYGMFLNFPHFWGTKRIGNEASYTPHDIGWVESVWIHAYPNSTGFDDPASNPAFDPNLWKLRCKSVLVYAAENDIFKSRGLYYVETLRKSKWNGTAKAVEVKGEGHVFQLKFPNSTNAKKMINHLAYFLNDVKEMHHLPYFLNDVKEM